MPPFRDLTGQRFGRLTVVAIADRQREVLWRCRCDCGRETRVRSYALRSGRTTACRHCGSKTAATTHGGYGTPLYTRWRAMLNRTGNPNHVEYHRYGGRGITVCAQWQTFDGFARDMAAGFRADLQLERIDNDRGYEPGNCRWATVTDQNRNRVDNHRLTHQGITLTLAEWGERTGLRANTILQRLRRGWTVDRALETR